MSRCALLALALTLVACGRSKPADEEATAGTDETPEVEFTEGAEDEKVVRATPSRVDALIRNPNADRQQTVHLEQKDFDSMLDVHRAVRRLHSKGFYNVVVEVDVPEKAEG